MNLSLCLYTLFFSTYISPGNKRKIETINRVVLKFGKVGGEG